MKKRFLVFALVILAAVLVGGYYFFNSSEEVNPEPEVIDESEIIAGPEMVADEVAVAEIEEYAYSFDLPENFAVYTEGYDNAGAEEQSTVWVGPESDFWTDGFYVRTVSDLDSRLSEVQDDVAEVVGQTETTLAGQNATKVVVGWMIGYEVAYYFVEANGSIFEIQVKNSNEDAQSVIQTIQFAE